MLILCNNTIEREIRTRLLNSYDYTINNIDKVVARIKVVLEYEGPTEPLVLNR